MKKTCKTCWYKSKRNPLRGNYMPCAKCDNDLSEYVSIESEYDESSKQVKCADSN